MILSATPLQDLNLDRQCCAKPMASPVQQSPSSHRKRLRASHQFTDWPCQWQLSGLCWGLPGSVGWPQGPTSQHPNLSPRTPMPPRKPPHDWSRSPPHSSRHLTGHPLDMLIATMTLPTSQALGTFGPLIICGFFRPTTSHNLPWSDLRYLQVIRAPEPCVLVRESQMSEIAHGCMAALTDALARCMHVTQLLYKCDVLRRSSQQGMPVLATQ
jgi:hypothetical protein